MPSKIWLHKNTKYSTGDIVCGYQYDFAQGIEDEGGIENFVKYVPADAFIEKAADYIKKDMLDNLAFQGRLNRIEIIDGIIEKFIKAMKRE